MKFKQPTAEQLQAMEEFAGLCSQALDMILRYQPDFTLQSCGARIQEAMGHFHAFIINGGKLLPTKPKDETVN